MLHILYTLLYIRKKQKLSGIAEAREERTERERRSGEDRRANETGNRRRENQGKGCRRPLRPSAASPFTPSPVPSSLLSSVCWFLSSFALVSLPSFALIASARSRLLLVRLPVPRSSSLPSLPDDRPPSHRQPLTLTRPHHRPGRAEGAPVRLWVKSSPPPHHRPTSRQQTAGQSLGRSAILPASPRPSPSREVVRVWQTASQGGRSPPAHPADPLHPAGVPGHKCGHLGRRGGGRVTPSGRRGSSSRIRVLRIIDTMGLL